MSVLLRDNLQCMATTSGCRETEQYDIMLLNLEGRRSHNRVSLHSYSNGSLADVGLVERDDVYVFGQNIVGKLNHCRHSVVTIEVGELGVQAHVAGFSQFFNLLLMDSHSLETAA